MDSILRTKDVLDVVGFARTTLWRRVKSGDFPQPVRLGGAGSRAVGWRSGEVERWLAETPECVTVARNERRRSRIVEPRQQQTRGRRPDEGNPSVVVVAAGVHEPRQAGVLMTGWVGCCDGRRSGPGRAR